MLARRSLSGNEAITRLFPSENCVVGIQPSFIRSKFSRLHIWSLGAEQEVCFTSGVCLYCFVLPVDPAIFVLDKFTPFNKASNGQSFILVLLEIFCKQTELQDSKELYHLIVKFSEVKLIIISACHQTQVDQEWPHGTCT